MWEEGGESRKIVGGGGLVQSLGSDASQCAAYSSLLLEPACIELPTEREAREGACAMMAWGWRLPWEATFRTQNQERNQHVVLDHFRIIGWERNQTDHVW